MANLTFAQLEQLIAQAGGTPSQQQILAGIAEGVESSGNPVAHNPSSTASGLWQELTTTWESNGGTAYAPTAAQATPEQQAIVAVNQTKSGHYQPWAPDLTTGEVSAYYSTDPSISSPTAVSPDSPVGRYLASNPVGGGSNTPSASPSSSSDTGSAASGAATAKPTGLAGVLVDIDNILNPSPNGGLIGTVTGVSQDVSSVEEIVVRIFFALGFGVIIYLGIKQFTGGGGSTNVIQLVQTQQRIGQANERIAQRDKLSQEATARAEAAQASRERIAATPRVSQQNRRTVNLGYRESHVYHHPTGQTKGATSAASKVSRDVLEI